MFKIDGNTFHLSRGDYASFDVKFKDGSTYYQFQPGDVLRFTVGRNFRSENYALQKEVTVTTATDTVNFVFTEDETLFNGPIAKPVEYQYDLVLNDIYSVLCYNQSGPRRFILYPRSTDITD